MAGKASTAVTPEGFPRLPESKKRATAAEQDYRVRKMLQLSKIGWSIDQLEDYATEEWGITRKTARIYIHRMLDLCVDAVSALDKRRIAAVTLQRFEQAYRLAASQRNPSAMVAANAQIAAYWVKAAPEITYSEPPSTAEDPEEDF